MPPEGALVLDGREHDGMLNDRIQARLMIRGEPALCARELAPHARNRSGPKDPDHEAVIRFYGQGSEAAGPFSQRHCSHSRIRIAATSDRHRQPVASARPSAEPLHVLSCLRERCSDRRPQHDAPRTSPVVTRRHNAISSLRASATIMVVLRTPLGPSVRDQNHERILT